MCVCVAAFHLQEKPPDRIVKTPNQSNQNTTSRRGQTKKDDTNATLQKPAAVKQYQRPNLRGEQTQEKAPTQQHGCPQLQHTTTTNWAFQSQWLHILAWITGETDATFVEIVSTDTSSFHVSYIFPDSKLSKPKYNEEEKKQNLNIKVVPTS